MTSIETHIAEQRSCLKDCLDRMAFAHELSPSRAMAMVTLHGEGGRATQLRASVDAGILEWAMIVPGSHPPPDLDALLRYAGTGYSPQIRLWDSAIQDQPPVWMSTASIPIYPGFASAMEVMALKAVAAQPLYRTFEALAGDNALDGRS